MSNASEDDELDRKLLLDAAHVTEAAALAAALWRGRGNEMAADKAAGDAMHQELSSVHINGKIIVGEGEQDDTDKLFVGEALGLGCGPEVEIAVDALEGATICAKAMSNALSVLAFAAPGGLLKMPDMYMDKIAIGPGYPDGIIDLDNTPAENLNAVANAKGVPIGQITACILDRARNADLIKAVREAGAAIRLIPDGDIAGVIWTTEPRETGVDIYFGVGGAREGVFAAAALRCTGGQLQGRLSPANADERRRAADMGLDDLNRKYTTLDMASGDVIFAATGITSGILLSGVRFQDNAAETETLIMRSRSGAVRRIRTKHKNVANRSPE